MLFSPKIFLKSTTTCYKRRRKKNRRFTILKIWRIKFISPVTIITPNSDRNRKITNRKENSREKFFILVKLVRCIGNRKIQFLFRSRVKQIFSSIIVSPPMVVLVFHETAETRKDTPTFAVNHNLRFSLFLSIDGSFFTSGASHAALDGILWFCLSANAVK